MKQNKDFIVLKFLNRELKKYKVKLEFQYYDTCPFVNNKSEILKLVLKYSEMFESVYNKIFILSSLCDEEFKDCIPYLVKIYQFFISEIYNSPIDEIYLLHICNTIAKINALEYIDLYKNILLGNITQSAEPIIEMVSQINIENFEDIVFSLIKKENLIPKAWIGELNEDCKYWCSLVALKCIINKMSGKYLEFFKELSEDKDMKWINISDSKYKTKLTLELKNKYKLLAEKGIKLLK